MSTLGVVTGVLTGSSRVPAVAGVLPSVLALVGGVVVYTVGKGNRQTTVITSVVVFSLSINLMIGTFWGAHIRQEFEDHRNSAEYKWKQFIDEQALEKLKKEYRTTPRR